MKAALLAFIAINILGAAFVAVTKQRRLAEQMDGGRTFHWPPWMPYVAAADLIVLVALLIWLNL